jgi:hypothetical protein
VPEHALEFKVRDNVLKDENAPTSGRILKPGGDYLR